MVDQRIVNYIRDGLQKGYSVEDLRSALLRQGWTPAEIQEAITIVQQPGMQAPQGAVSPQPKTVSRPMGITIISILGFIVSVLAIIGGFVIIDPGGLMSSSFGEITINTTTTGIGLFDFGDVDLVFILLGLIPLILGIISLLAFILVLKMKKMGLLLVIILGIISVIMSVLTFSFPISIVGIVIWIIILIYLMVKRSLFA